MLCSGLCEVSSSGNSWQEEADLEQAFQHALLQDVAAANQASDSGLHLGAAVQQLDIDNLLKKLVCGELQYNPHEPHR